MKQLEYVVLLYSKPGAPDPKTFGVVLLDRQDNALYVQTTERWRKFDKGARPILSGLAEWLLSSASDYDAVKTFETMVDSFSSTVAVSDPRRIEGDDPKVALQLLFQQHVDSDLR